MSDNGLGPLPAIPVLGVSALNLELPLPATQQAVSPNPPQEQVEFTVTINTAQTKLPIGRPTS
jgi:hypothetical protein